MTCLERRGVRDGLQRSRQYARRRSGSGDHEHDEPKQHPEGSAPRAKWEAPPPRSPAETPTLPRHAGKTAEKLASRRESQVSYRAATGSQRWVSRYVG
jgi:hypothetical protein